MKIRLDAVRVCYGPTIALHGLDLDVAPGEWLALLGPSGSGKTSALRAIAGFERIAGGRVSLDGMPVADARTYLPPEKRGPGFVFQEFALFPHLSAAENIAFGLRHLSRAARADRVREMLALVELEGYGHRAPSALSGGQQQRVALARALAPEPPALLMDEPFGSLDPALRSAVRARVVAALRARGCTVIFISHDIDEAFEIADRLALLKAGTLRQIGPPAQLFEQPASAFVAGFMGPVNLLPGIAEGDHIQTRLGRLRLARPAQGPRLAVVRPHAITSDPSGVAATVTARIYRGPRIEATVRTGDATADDPPIRVDLPPDRDTQPGHTLRLAVASAVETVAADADQR